MAHKLPLNIVPVCVLLTLLTLGNAPFQEAYPIQPPEHIVKLIFIHHSTGENWLMDGYGDLGRALGENNYFVSDTNYGWGPNAIGDRTDIPDWLEWFRSEQTPEYMQALFLESGQHSGYTRVLADPGGENEIVMFKSCFPNSALDGNPNDSPGTEAGFTVSGAKYVYNELLKYFITRPDKLFVVITAPPLSDATFASNARAFNLWLLNDWLRENQYPLNNVAVFDFFNVLTGKEHHHRIINDRLEHVFTPGRDTLVYPTEDDHPSIEGSRKATQEFIPLLNYYYHRWQETAPLESPLPPTETQAVVIPPALPPTTSLIDDFESGIPQNTLGWMPYWDESVPTSMECALAGDLAYQGTHSLHMKFQIPAGSWATCALMYESGMQDWSDFTGITFYVHADQAHLPFDFNIYAGAVGAQETYLTRLQTLPESIAGWSAVTLHWSDFTRASWEENAGTAFDKANQVLGMAFGFSSAEGEQFQGEMWIDELNLLPSLQEMPTEPPTPPTASPTEEVEEGSEARPSLPCAAAPVLFATSLSFFMRKRKVHAT